MSLKQLVNQEFDPKKVENTWTAFARDLIFIQKAYKNADPNFKSALGEYAKQIEKGFGLSKNSQNGFSLTNKYVVNSFVKIFDPILNFETKKKSLITNDLILLLSAKKKLTSQLNLLSNHLSFKNSYEFAEMLRFSHIEIDSRISNHTSSEGVKDLIESGETIRMLASILYTYCSNLKSEKIEWCICCFRRAKKNSKYCPIHSPKSSENNYSYRKYRKLRKKIRKSLKKKQQPLTVYYKSLRQIFNSVQLHPFNKPLYFSDNELLKTNVVVTNELIFSLAQATQKQPWSYISEDWYQLIKIHFPFIHNLYANKATAYAVFEEFVSSIRESLDEKIETENHPLWVIFELNKAEDWLAANAELYKNNEKLVIKLFVEGKTVKDILIIVGLKKSRVYEILKEIKLKKL